MKCFWVFPVILAPIILTACGLNIETLKYCCGLGTNYANSGSQCIRTSFQTPIANVEKNDEKSCLNSVVVCCRTRSQELQCDLGKEDAQSSGNCATDSDFRKDCCDACQLGIETGNQGGSCQDSLGLGQMSDNAFMECCKDISKSTLSTTVSSSTTSTTERSRSSDTFRSTYQDTYYSSSNLAPNEDLCYRGDICAQICIPTDGSFKCDCKKGFTLMADGVSCKPDKKTSKKKDRCEISNPCDHNCIDTGVAVKCSCRPGYELEKDKRTCKDIDECALGTHDCEENLECVNEEGNFYCDEPDLELDNDDYYKECPPGYRFNGESLLCDDIDECEIGITCPRPKNCINTIGSFKCEGEDRPQCPPGFHFKPAIDTCADTDECITGENDCNKESQICLNTIGNYTCTDKVSKTTCPPGFKKNAYTQNCDDINECEETNQLCGPNEECVNEPGGHTCLPKTTNKQTTMSSTTIFVPQTTTLITTTTTTTTTPKPTTTPTTPKRISCRSGFRYSPLRNDCEDINECQEDKQTCDSSQDCYNMPGSFVCSCKTGFMEDPRTGACIDVNECQLGNHECTVAQRCDNTIGSYLCARLTGCGTGYTLNYANGLCEDDDECTLGTHNCNDIGREYKCRNTLGSYRCEPPRVSIPRTIPTRTYPTRTSTTLTYPTRTTVIYPTRSSRVPIQTTRTSPSISYPIQTYPIIRKPLGPVFPSPHTTSTLTYPILSGQLKKCLPGYIMNARGGCDDIDECQTNPCTRGYKCLNFNGRYQCISPNQCKIGYELDDTSNKCIDVNECMRGTHKCNPTQICKNGEGYYTCECPPGHHLNDTNKLCEDIDECQYYTACSVNADCFNTIGSYRCRCKDGFYESGNSCEDIDECKKTMSLCEHNCVNTWGSYRCACNSGYTLNYDNRTCTDIDECEKFKDRRLCIGTCQNVPGSYTCTCPKGYNLGSDRRTCRDIDECEQYICPRPDDVCLNTKGGYKCYVITCPPNYFRDPDHKGRCKRPPTLCDARDMQCINKPEQYTYHYIALVSNLPISKENIQFFQIKGPQWAPARAEFTMKMVNVHCPRGIDCVNDYYFKIDRSRFNTMHLFLVRPIIGPQEIELRVEMKLYQGNIMTGRGVSHIFILVSEYSF